MSLPSDVPELATPSEAAADEAEVARCLEEAARMVQNFADAGGTAAFVALLATPEDPGPAALKPRTTNAPKDCTDFTWSGRRSPPPGNGPT